MHKMIFACATDDFQKSWKKWYFTNKNIKISSFKSSENIQKKEGGPDRLRNFVFGVFSRQLDQFLLHALQFV